MKKDEPKQTGINGQGYEWRYLVHNELRIASVRVTDDGHTTRVTLFEPKATFGIGKSTVLIKAHGSSESGSLPELVMPPRSAKFMLLLLPPKHREHLLGDLEEEYKNIILPEYGQEKAQLWYWWQVCASIVSLLWGELKPSAVLAWLWKFVN